MKAYRNNPKLSQKVNQTGITLIELLISLVIISIVVTLCANGFTFGNKVWAKVDGHQNNLDEVASAQRFLRKVLSEAIFYPLEEDQAKDNYFNGDEEKMIFLAPSPQYGLDDYLYIYEIFKEKENGVYDLSIRYLPANTYFSGKARTADRDVKLIENVKDIKFEYYGFNQTTGAQSWSDSWLDQEALPIRVSITVEPFEKPSRNSVRSSAKSSTRNAISWPPLVVETKYGGYRLP